MSVEPLNRCLALRTQWKSHEHGALAFANSTGAHFGFSSRVGRVVDRYAILHSEALPNLDAIISDFHGIRACETSPPEPSPASRAMIETRTLRTTRTLVPMTIACTHAARAYTAERLQLLGDIMALVINAGRTPGPGLQRELRTWQTLRTALASLMAERT